MRASAHQQAYSIASPAHVFMSASRRGQVARRQPQLAQSGRRTVLPIGLINAHGRFPYQRDAIAFKNREAQLPLQPPGHYREYTVPTSGVTGRGARRIVQGATGELFYTRDHYPAL
jgi:ribonuclease T1